VISEEIYLKRTSENLSESNENVRVHETTMTLPSSYYLDLLLRIGFTFSISNTVENTSAGIDDFIITAHGLCAPTPLPEYPTIGSSTDNSHTVNSVESSQTECEEKVLEEYSKDFEELDPIRHNMIIEEFGVYGNFLGRYSKSNPSTWKEYFVDPDALHVTIEFEMYEIGDWSSDDKFVVKVEDKVMIDMGQFSGTLAQNDAYSGTVGDINFSRNSSGAPTNIAFGESKDQIHEVSLDIPSNYFSNDGKFMLSFEVTIQNSKEIASAGFAKLKITEHYRCAGNNSAAHSCEGIQTITEENFDGNDGSWNNMIIGTFASYGNFLGPYDRNGNSPSKSFAVPPNTEKIDIEFDFLEINQWEIQDDFFAIINNVIVPFGLPKDKEEANSNDGGYIFSDGGIELFRQATVTSEGIRHAVVITVPNKFFEDDSIDFEVLLSSSTESNQSFGIGKFKIEAHGVCGRRSLEVHAGTTDDSLTNKGFYYDGGIKSVSKEEQKQTNNKKEKVSDADIEEGPYCLAKDYPCDGGDNMAYACHYSGRQGYQTFCIPEEDSEIIRFYPKDYCGPCVGGYGGVDWSTEE